MAVTFHLKVEENSRSGCYDSGNTPKIISIFFGVRLVLTKTLPVSSAYQPIHGLSFVFDIVSCC